MRAVLLSLLAMSLSGRCAMGYESIYPQTDPGKIEIKQLPARLSLVAVSPGDAFDDRGAAFRKLFAYIQTNQFAMSVPVETRPSVNEMVFLVGSQDRERGPRPDGGVEVRVFPATTVASIGLRGGYSRANYERGLRDLQAWLAAHPDWRTNGAPVAVYWNSPFRLWFLRRSEIHQPVVPADGANESAFYRFSAQHADGRAAPLSDYRNRVLLVVNTASRCGFTPQYDGLEKLYQRYRSRGFEILGFPADDFLHQEPGTDAEIQSFCRVKYGVTFPVFAKIHVKGSEQHPLYRWLTDPETHPAHGGAISWNFNKFLVDRTGRVVARFGSRTTPDAPELLAAVEQALGPAEQTPEHTTPPDGSRDR